jgi:hypothetical protein
MELAEIARLINGDMFLDPPISVDSLKTVNDFTLLWMIYEGRLYDSNYKSFRMIELVNSGVIRLSNLDEYWTYFKERYMTSSAVLNTTFDQLAFSEQSKNDKNRLMVILTNRTPTDKERTIAILLIVARLRNNLFHGIKQVASLNLQSENLEMATKALGEMLRRVHLHFLDSRT